MSDMSRKQHKYVRVYSAFNIQFPRYVHVDLHMSQTLQIFYYVILYIGGRNLPRELSRPQIGYFNIGAEDGDVWCLPVSLTDDEEPEPPRRLQVELFVSDINVVAVRRVVDLTIIDDDRTSK